MQKYLEEAKALQQELVEWRRWLHLHAEVGDVLPKTKEFVREKLIAFGCEPVEICESGFMVNIGGKKPGKCILFRADMDALPMMEESGLPFACDNGNAHSCGHDMHTTMLLGAAKILKAHEEELCGTVKLMFQPGEEDLGGAERMVEAGILENPNVDAAITQHVTTILPHPAGTLQVPTGGYGMTSCDVYRIVVTGEGGHGAYPDRAVDPITVAAHIHGALQELNAREIPAGEVVVLTQGTFHSGDAANIIPVTATMEGTLRTLNDDIRKRILERMGTICRSIGEAFRAEVEFKVLGGCSPLYNNPDVCGDAGRYLEELVGTDGVKYDDGPPAMASEDFSNVLKYVPGLQIMLAMGDGNHYVMHNPKVVFDERPMYIGAAGMAYIGKRWLEEHAD